MAALAERAQQATPASSADWRQRGFHTDSKHARLKLLGLDLFIAK